MSKPTCLVTAPVATRSGYGAHSRDIVRSLIKLDRYDVKIWSVRWGSTPMNALNVDDENDKIISQNGLEVYIPKKAYIFLAGTFLDYSDGLIGKGFEFINHN